MSINHATWPRASPWSDAGARRGRSAVELDVVAGDVTLGDRVVIGAGAVVVKDFAGPGVLVGVPAHHV